MKKIVLSLLALWMLNQQAIAQRSDCAASPYPIEITQANGTKLTVITKGTESLHYRETAEGYTILPNKDGIYEYAVLDQSGNLQLSGFAAADQIGATMMGKQALQKHLRFSTIQEQAIKADFFAMSAQALEMGKTVEVPYPANGNIRVLAICMQFPDELPIYPISALNDLLNQPNYNGTGSFKDYFRDNSFGKLNVTVDVVGWYTSSLPRESYGRNLNNGATNSNYMTNVRALIAQGIDSADIRGGVDFSIYDNDNNGSVDGIIVFHAGFGAEQSMNGYIWSHRSSLWGNSVRVKNGKTVSSYCINPLKRVWNGETTMVGLGVLAHEFGHIMGLPDLYDTQGSSQGIGNFGLMGACGWLNREQTPCQLEAWSKDQFDWVRPVIVNQISEWRIPQSTDSAFAIRLNTPRANEYYLIENKQPKGWDKFVPGRGLAIWHINTQRTSLYPGSNNVNADTARYGVGLIQADGQRHLERGTNRGDAGDLFPGTLNNRNFNENTNPAALLHTQSGTRVPSRISISNIVINADSSVSFRVSMGAAAFFTASPASGCAPLNVRLNNSSVGFERFEWLLPDGATDSTNLNPNFVFTEPGTYQVKLKVVGSDGIADSSIITINTFPSPKADMDIVQIGDSIVFTNRSVDAAFTQWLFNNNTSSTANQVIKQVPTEGLSVRLIAFNNNGCSDTVSYSTVPFATSLPATLSQADWKVYPNPSKDVFYIQCAQCNENVFAQVFNLLGEEVYNTQITPEILHSGYALNGIQKSGVYVVRMSSAIGTHTIRLVKVE